MSDLFFHQPNGALPNWSENEKKKKNQIINENKVKVKQKIKFCVSTICYLK